MAFEGEVIEAYTSPYRGVVVRPPTPEKKGVMGRGTTTLGENIAGIGEMAVTLGTGVYGQLEGGLQGIGETIRAAVSGEDDPFIRGAEKVNEIVQKRTWRPRSEAGQDLASMVGAGFEPIERATFGAGKFVQDVTGSAGAAAATKAGLEFLPSLFNIRNVPALMDIRSTDVKVLNQIADDLGLDLDQPTSVLREQIIEAVRKQTGGQSQVAEGMTNLQQSIMRAREVNKKYVDQLYEEARGLDAGIAVADAKDLYPQVREALEDWDYDISPRVSKRLQELEALTRLPDNAVLKLDGVARFRRRINNAFRGATPEETAMLSIIKGQLDSHIDSLYNRDMITGNPAAIEKWRAANNAYRDYAERFKPNKVIEQLGRQEATPEQIKNWILGTTAMGAKKNASDLITQVESIVGNASPNMAALRQEVLFDIMSPLLNEEPNFGQFVRNYDRFVKNNPSLKNKLFPDSAGEMEKLRLMAPAVERRGIAGIDIDINQALARIMFGHGISRAALKVSLADQVIGLIRSAGTKQDKTAIMADILGYDPNMAMIPLTPIGTGGAIQTGMDIDDEQ